MKKDEKGCTMEFFIRHFIMKIVKIVINKSENKGGIVITYLQ